MGAMVAGDPGLVGRVRAVFGQDRAAAGVAEHMGAGAQPVADRHPPVENEAISAPQALGSGTSSRYFRMPPLR